MTFIAKCLKYTKVLKIFSPRITGPISSKLDAKIAWFRDYTPFQEIYWVIIEKNENLMATFNILFNEVFDIKIV